MLTLGQGTPTYSTYGQCMDIATTWYCASAIELALFDHGFCLLIGSQLLSGSIRIYVLRYQLMYYLFYSSEYHDEQSFDFIS